MKRILPLFVFLMRVAKDETEDKTFTEMEVSTMMSNKETVIRSVC